MNKLKCKAGTYTGRNYKGIKEVEKTRCRRVINFLLLCDFLHSSIDWDSCDAVNFAGRKLRTIDQLTESTLTKRLRYHLLGC